MSRTEAIEVTDVDEDEKLANFLTMHRKYFCSRFCNLLSSLLKSSDISALCEVCKFCQLQIYRLQHIIVLFFFGQQQ